MVARFSAAGLGLLAFSISVTAGVLAQNPVEVTLSRSIFALFTFCFLGLLLGAAAQRVVDEHEKKRVGEIKEQYREDSTVMEGGEPVTIPAASSGQLNDA